MPDDAFTVAQFCSVAGFSAQRLYVLWKEGRGPKRLTRKRGKANRVLIPFKDGMTWLLERYPDRAAAYDRLVREAREPETFDRAWSPFPVVIKGARRNV